MIGILVAIAISWLLLYFFEKQHILALGLLPVTKRIRQFLTGFLITGLLCIMAQYLEAFLRSGIWVLNENISGATIARSFWWDVRSVLTEELIFRGALLYILIRRIGTAKSILISAIAFGIYHWFSFGILGNIVAMILIFIGTGLMGYAWAWAFAKTRSIMLPFGFHLGWNFFYNTVFSKGPLGELLLVLQRAEELTDTTSLLNFLTGMILVPILVLLYVKYFVKAEAQAVPVGEDG
ncbi:CPBP family intramembrane glutamic endopeptidase [Flavilitoribacter nigricans]|uniref:CPBP family intramembrane metalloprotease n=1 Tax=Flavilitoribacter nigricans (strain ATCC 23147 / DSM 23189 / NBRC 102662 / NCIMB 1420 / SS-2) TaxID=1122177 RepID=A0A2D0N0I2_FLAN2|nr:CPBP family intramembrane glutamic endopeptidase [Flavilitoribacter nigricans]PHN02024.1 CPBP family intramembrane metalloprotease [Flavilitoribacter nigricans DSM 23189 = NBRC 102662]